MAGESNLVIADKFGSVYCFTFDQHFKPTTKNPTLPLGHYSIISDMKIFKRIGSGEELIATCDRDEKLRISKWPNAYDIESFCLGHSQFISKICIVQSEKHNLDLIVSGGGDNLLCGWDYMTGTQYFKFDYSQCLTHSTLSSKTHQLFQAQGLTISSLIYCRFCNVLLASVEYCDLLLAFKIVNNGSNNCQLEFVSQHSLFIVPSDLQLLHSSFGHTSTSQSSSKCLLLATGVPVNSLLSEDVIAQSIDEETEAKCCPVQVYSHDFCNQSSNPPSNPVHFESSVTVQLKKNAYISVKPLAPAQAEHTFLVNSVEENLRKILKRRGGAPHPFAGPSAKRAFPSENSSQQGK